MIDNGESGMTRTVLPLTACSRCRAHPLPCSSWSPYELSRCFTAADVQFVLLREYVSRAERSPHVALT